MESVPSNLEGKRPENEDEATNPICCRHVLRGTKTDAGSLQVLLPGSDSDFAKKTLHPPPCFKNFKLEPAHFPLLERSLQFLMGATEPQMTQITQIVRICVICVICVIYGSLALNALQRAIS